MDLILPEITENCGANPAGLLAVYAIRTQLVVSVPRMVNGIISDDIELAVNAEWARIGFADESAGFDEKQTSTASGELYKQTVTLIIADDRADMADYLQTIRQGTFLLLIEQPKGGFRLVGHPDAPARHIADVVIESKGSGRNGIIFQFEARSWNRCPFYSGSIAGIFMLRFFFNALGELLVDNTYVPATTAAINVDGELVITGPDETHYSISTNGDAVYTP